MTIYSTIGNAFEGAVRNHGDRLAIFSIDKSCTYSELAERTDVQRTRIEAVGEAADRPVIIAYERGIEMVTLILGASLAGRPWSVVAPATSPAMLDHVLRTIGPCDIACAPGSLETFERFQKPGTRILPNDRSQGSSATPVHASSPAAICLTSGSTSLPKGVVMRHDACVHNAVIAARSLDLAADDRYLWIAAPGSAATCMQIFTALLNGACLVPFDLAGRGFMALAEYLAQSRVSVYHSIPSVLRRFVASLSDNSAFRFVRVVKLGGESLFQSDVVRFFDVLPKHGRIVNGLGMSETNGNVCHATLSRSEKFKGPVPIGFPLPDFKLEICDDDGNALAPGCSGRLRVESDYIAHGYWKPGGGQIERFDSAGPGRTSRVFLSEDRCRQLNDGRFVHLGRSDDIAKIRGTRVSLSGLEAALREIENIGDVVLQYNAPPGAESYIAACVEPAFGTLLTPETVRRSLREHLPAAAVPATISIVDQFPLLASGKIDRAALFGIADTQGRIADDVDVENDLARMSELFGKAIGVGAFGHDDDFFDSGGDSLQAVTLATMVETSWPCIVDPGLLASNPTPRMLLAALDDTGIRPAYRLTEVRPGRPLWLFAGAGDPIYYLLPLAREIGEVMTVYGFVAGFDSRGKVTTRIGDMTEPMLNTIKAIQPDGPYLLAGTSFGGWLAFDIATRLASAGEEVGFLGMLDAAGPGYPRIAAAAPIRARLQHLDRRLFRRYRPWQSGGRLVSRLIGLFRRTRSLVNLMQRTDDLSDLTPIERSWLLEESCLLAKRRYVPAKYAGPMFVFQAEAPAGSFYRPDCVMGWQTLADQKVKSIPITGVHGAHMGHPNARGLATSILALVENMR